MIVLFASLFVGVLLAEISIRIISGTWLRDRLRKFRSLISEFRKATGDDERQELLLCCGLDTLQFSLTLLLIMGGGAVVFFAPFKFEMSQFERTVYLIVTSVVATMWWMVRRSKYRAQGSLSPFSLSGNTYNILERWLHWLALEPAAVRHLAFDLERQFSLPKRSKLVSSNMQRYNGMSEGAVYICGLARSGTTMLLQVLNEVDDFRSLKYRDMPFVLAPNLWRLITQYFPIPSVPEERAHGDGIHVHFDSPEGFEEVFWRTFSELTLNSHCLTASEPTKAQLTAFADYRAIVANPQINADFVNDKLRRYLSKNNNNLLRLPCLCADPTATVLLVYRNPIASARSLHRQHQRFCAAQADHHFTRRYMGWLVHHEFGLDHLPFCFAVPEMNDSLSPDDPNYWLDYWIAVYRYILAQNDLRLYFVNHDALRRMPEEMLKKIFETLCVQADAVTLAKKITVTTSADVGSEGFNTELLCRAESTYRALLGSAKNIYHIIDTEKSNEQS